MAWSLLAHAIDADVAGLDQRGGAGARLYHPRVPQPFIETLAIQIASLDYSLRLASCSFSAASFANGEFGSMGRSRSRGAALVAHWRCDGPLSRLSRPPLSRPPKSRPPLSRPPLLRSPLFRSPWNLSRRSS